MYKILSNIKKELLLLVRDIPALIFLFVLPMILFMVITLAQEKTLKSIAEPKNSLLYVDEDNSSYSKSIENDLLQSKYFEIIKTHDGY